MILSALAAPTTDRVTEIRHHKICGPVPWEAYQFATIGQVRDKSLDLDVGGSYQLATQNAQGELSVNNAVYTDLQGDVFALPMNGEQWTSMYLTYMHCICRTESGVNVERLWKDALTRGDFLNTAEDVDKFFRSASALTSLPVETWWTQTKEMRHAEIRSALQPRAERIDENEAAIDRLLADTRELRNMYNTLKQAHDALRKEFDEFKKSAVASDEATEKMIKALEKRIDAIEKSMDLFKAVLESKAE